MTLDTSMVLFPGKKQYERFAKYFEFILKKYSNEIKDDYDMDIRDIGDHLLRKGVPSYVSSGSTCTPLAISYEYSSRMDDGKYSRYVPAIRVRGVRER